MEENSKLFVFEKKEVFLIFIFIIMIAAIAFTLGVKTGKQLSLKEDEYSREDIENIELKSVAEESADMATNTGDNEVFEPKKTIVDEQAELEARLKAEMEKLATGEEEIVSDAPAAAGSETITETMDEPEVSADVAPVEDLYNQDKVYENKYTIQLYSNQSEEAAKDFADGFIAKGYDVIIREAVIPGKGTWYRVSIGAFESIDDAKAYLVKEKNLFQGNNYIIQQF